MSALVMFDVESLRPELGAPPPERIIAGDPRFTTWNFDEAAGGLYAGIWESTPGHWRIHYDEWEFCQILSGESVLHEDGAGSIHLKAGDSFVIRPGFRGSWEVRVTTRKTYVIRV